MSGLTFDTLDTPIEQALEELIEAVETLVFQAERSLDRRDPFRSAILAASNAAASARCRLEGDA